MRRCFPRGRGVSHHPQGPARDGGLLVRSNGVAEGLRRWSWAATLALFLSIPLAAQALAMRHFDRRDGLPQSQVRVLLEDRHGFIWAGTNEGVTRLGPNGHQLFDASSGLRARDIVALLEDRSGAIWVASAERGVARIRGREVSTFGLNEGLPDESTRALLETRRGDLLVGSGQGLVRLQGERFERVPLPAPWNLASIQTMAEDPEGWVWFGARTEGVARWRDGVVEAAALPPAAEPSPLVAIRTDPSGQVWVVESDRILRRSADGRWQVESLPGLPSSVVFTDLAFTPAGELLLSLGSDGLYQRQANGRHRLLNRQNLLCRDAINCVLRDRNGGLWIGTDGDYLWVQALPGLWSLTHDTETDLSLGLGSVTSFLALPGNRMLFGSNNGVILWQQGKGVLKRWSRKDGLPSEDVWMLHEDGGGGAWVGTMKGLCRLGGDQRIHPGPRELAKSHIQCMVRQGSRLWVGTDLGLVELDLQGRVLRQHSPMKGTAYTPVHCLLARGEELFVGTSTGLLRFEQGTFHRFLADGPADRVQILALQADARQRLWVGTSQNLLVNDPVDGSWSNLDLEADGQPLYGITWIRGLSSGGTAIGHAKGVTVTSREGKPALITHRLGLISDETNQGGALEDAQGRLWIGMVGGACFLEPGASVPAYPLPTPVVLDITWERGAFWMPKEATLPPGYASLVVHVDSGSPNTPFPVRFEAQLEDLGGSWQALESGNGSIQFGGLSPGTHLLRFRTSLDGAVWNEAAPLRLTIKPTWYQTLWARLALMVALATICILTIRARFRTLERNNEALEGKVRTRTKELQAWTRELALRNQGMEWTQRQLKDTLESRMQMINTVSHDLRSPLTTILLSVERLHGPAQKDPGLARVLGIMKHEGQRLEGILKGLLDKNRAESMVDRLSMKLTHPEDLLENLGSTLELKAEARGLQTRLDLGQAAGEVWTLLDSVAMRQVLFNLVENALKFTEPPGAVGVRTRVREKHWDLEVWDTGRGIPKAECERLFHPFEQGQTRDAQKGWGLGLYICRSIVEAHGGRIEVESEVGSGSVFRVSLPLVGTETPA